MSFLTVEFWGFFLIFLLSYWLARPWIQLQKVMILSASYYIVYCFSPNFLLILFGYSCAVYLFSIGLKTVKHRQPLFIFSLFSVLTNLAVFKYFDFFRNEIQSAIALLGLDVSLPVLQILMPIGISFYTFHSISYLVSIKRDEIALPNALDFALFIAFFPSLIAGPINRAAVFLPQIQATEAREILAPQKALFLLSSALLKVWCLSSLLDEYWVSPAFENPMAYSTLTLLIALYSYSLQIYLNFSGYTELVTAIALLLGYRLPPNFNFPYLASSLKAFWARWHISLSTFIRDYIYFPLGGSRQGFGRTQFNLMVAMILSGLWHGTTINFVLWGAIHGAGLILYNLFLRYVPTGLGKGKIADFWGRVITFHFVTFAWIFFRADTIADSQDYLAAMMNNLSVESGSITNLLYLLGLSLLFVLYPLWVRLMNRVSTKIDNSGIYWVSALTTVALLGIIIFSPDGIPGFIYSNF